MKYRYLSYPVSEGMPVYGGRADIKVEATRSILRGDSANACRFLMESHWGTHVDAPRHFFVNGDSVENYPPRTWIFKTPEIINVHLAPSEILKLGNWTKKIRQSADILLFRSGWARFRKQDKYIYENPGIHPEAGVYLRKKCRRLRAIGIDWISISSAKDKSLGREAHRAFLNPKDTGRPLLIVEDMALSAGLSGLKSVIILPFVVSGTDSAPCTALGVFRD